MVFLLCTNAIQRLTSCINIALRHSCNNLKGSGWQPLHCEFEYHIQSHKSMWVPQFFYIYSTVTESSAWYLSFVFVHDIDLTTTLSKNAMYLNVPDKPVHSLTVLSVFSTYPPLWEAVRRFIISYCLALTLCYSMHISHKLLVYTLLLLCHVS